MVALITGAKGSVGQALLRRLPDAIPTDLDTMNVLDGLEVAETLYQHRPDIVYHLAGAKHAPEGELDPASVTETNVEGTRLVVESAEYVGARVILASTCKAADPETVYGASKLIAERIVLNAGGVVCRFYNVPEAQGNVFRYWESLLETDSLPVTDCWRYFITMEQAVDLLVVAADLPSGRYAVPPGDPRRMADVAWDLYPGREQEWIPPRRGDRHREPLHALSETWRSTHNGLMQITSPHDPVFVLQEAA